MPFGFPAYQEQHERFRDLSAKQLLRAADAALDELGWRPYRGGQWRLCATVPMRFHVIFLTWGARFTVDVEDEELFIRSQGAFPLEWMDVGQHSENINRFLDRLEEVLEEED